MLLKTARLKDLSFLLALFFMVLIVNLPLITFDMMYPEQPLIYLANQNIHSLKDLFQVYLHPKMFHASILFFRPSGHFLLYQLLTPLLGWHNTRGLIIINLGFLALTAYVLLKLYELLFPRLRWGAYIAIGIYLMHPALMLSRLIVLHFEFAYVFFTVLSLYCFVRFCQRGRDNFYLLASSLGLFLVAVSFKEPALFLGPVLLCYLAFSGAQGQAWRRDKKIRQISVLIISLSLSAALYLSLQWPTLKHPLRSEFNFSMVLAALHRLSFNIVGLQDQLFPKPIWRNVVFTPLARMLLWMLSLVTVVGSSLLYVNKRRACLSLRGALFATKQSRWIASSQTHHVAQNAPRDDGGIYQNSLSFLYLTSLIFLILPVCWGWGLPWHLSLTLLFLSMAMGFSFEYLGLMLIKNDKSLSWIAILFVYLLGWAAVQVNSVNIHYILSEQGFPLIVGRNAVLHPPLLKNLNARSVLVVEDSKIQDAYLLGASFYPYYSFKLSSPNLDADLQQFNQTKRSMFIQQQAVYNGTLFRWAYLNPLLKEEVYPFQVEHMQMVPDVILYNWLQHYDNIFCLGYDEQGAWHDRSELFKKNLLLEKSQRHLQVNDYDELPLTAFAGTALASRLLPFPEPQLCQLDCDQNQACRGFTYIHLEKNGYTLSECVFYDSLIRSNQQFCAACLSFIKR